MARACAGIVVVLALVLTSSAHDVNEANQLGQGARAQAKGERQWATTMAKIGGLVVQRFGAAWRAQGGAHLSSERRAQLVGESALLQVPAQSTPPTVTFWVLVIIGVVFVVVGGMIVFYNPANDPKPHDQQSPLASIFGSSPQSCAYPPCLDSMAADALPNLVSGFGVGLLLAVVGGLMTWLGFKQVTKPTTPEFPLHGDAHLSSLTTAEWTWQLTSSQVVAQSGACGSLSRGGAGLSLALQRTGQPVLNSNHWSVCGFCADIERIAAHPTHGNGNDACQTVPTLSSSTATLCPLLSRKSLSETPTVDFDEEKLLCGECDDGKYGDPQPSLAPCTECTSCETGKFLLGCRGGHEPGVEVFGTEHLPSPGSCVDVCPPGTFVHQSTCKPCAAGTYSTTAGSTTCTPYAACAGSTQLSRLCGLNNDCNTPCVSLPALAIMGDDTAAAFGTHSLRESRIPGEWYADHFAIRTAEGVRRMPFQDDVFDYEWFVESNINTNAFANVYLPFEAQLPIRIAGKFRTRPGHSSQLAAVLIQVPHKDERRYSAHNTWLVTQTNVYNKQHGWVFMQADNEMPTLVLKALGQKTDWKASQWADAASNTVANRHLQTEGVFVPVQTQGDWAITTRITLGKDPSLYNCPPLPVRITVLAPDGLATRVYTIHSVGSDGRQCFDSAFANAMREFQTLLR